MYRFLDFLETTVIDAHTSFDKGILLKEIDDYKHLWAKYEHCQKANPFYHGPTGEYNIHRFDISGKDAIFIIWDIGQLNEMSFGTPLYRKSLKDFKAMFKQDNYEALFHILCKHGKWHKIQNGNRAGKSRGGLPPIIAY